MKHGAALASLFLMGFPCLADDPGSAANGALHYYQAFLRVPPESKLSAEEKTALQQWKSCALDANAESLITKYQIALKELHRGWKAPVCAWGASAGLSDDGVVTAVPYSRPAWNLARASLLRARRLFAQGKMKEACEDILATLILARRIGTVGALESKQLEFGISTSAIELAAAYLLGCDRHTIGMLSGQLAHLPPSLTISDVIRSEKRLVIDALRTQGLQVAESVLPDFAGANEQRRQKIRTFLGLTDANLNTICNGVEKIYEDAAKVAAKPISECMKADKEFRQSLEKRLDTSDVPVANILPSILLPPITAARTAECELDARVELLRVAVAILTEGDQALKKHKDPFGTAEFEYSKGANGGFELRSKLLDRAAKPVKLVVSGRRE